MLFTQPTTYGAKQDEIATLEINGEYFSDWETVWIKNQIEVPYSEFRFTCAERDKPPDLWTKFQISTRSQVRIYLANVLAVTGVIIVRQVAYDANSHGVSLQGVGDSWFAARASIDPQVQGLTFSGDIVSIAEKVIAPTGVKVVTQGNIDKSPFDPPVQAGVGETIFSFLERIGRQKKVLIGSTEKGEWLLIGDNSVVVGAAVIEGFNILSAQFVINDIGAFNYYKAIGQRTGNDSTNMSGASEIVGVTNGNLGRFSPRVVAMEHPAPQHDAQLRADFEALTQMGTEITATVTVQGWFNPDGVLWKPYMDVTVDSPMAALPYTTVLTCVSVIFQQDRQGGTRTTLELKQPWAVLKYGYQLSDNDPRRPGANTTAAPPSSGGNIPTQF